MPPSEITDEHVGLKAGATYSTFDLEQAPSAAETREAFVLFTVIGFSYLFSCFALLQPVDYWQLLFPTFNAEFEISWVYNGASVATLLVLLWSGAAPAYVCRIVGGFAVILVTMVALPASHFVLTSQPQHLGMVLGSTALVSVATATVDGTVLSLASLFPTGGMEHVQLGMGFALLVSALYRVATKALFDSASVVPATMLFFGIAVLTVASGLVATFRLLRLPTAQRCIHHASKSQVIDFGILRKIWRHEALVSLAFGTTYVVYPGVVTTIPSYNVPALNASGWWPLLLMTLFAASEASGRVCVRRRLGFTHATVWKLVFPRLLLIPLLVCAANGIYLTHDAISIALVMVLGFSNGYVGTLCVIVVNDAVDPHEQSVTGMFASLCINLGIFSGATVSLVGARLLGR
ncbi:Aste57867_16323 [Aphanomyces stellatus]|uniref:Aste57867_16323 protein n=1 Tax=Aphanomyces stellatus TaxID=120398 RepID=A0A485L8E5_9STRA|nr:hypothetical protein As57867_016266 [Aphanomyces stellatus]VFT93099.1 Aste57867_16323 [Aphanomyces stellatus]